MDPRAMIGHFGKILAALLLAMGPARPVPAESLLVVSQPRTARGAPAGLLLRQYFPVQGFSSKVAQLPGHRLIQPLQMLDDMPAGIALVERNARRSSSMADAVSRELVLIHLDSLRPDPIAAEPGWEPVQVFCAPGSAGPAPRLAILERRVDGGGDAGRIRFALVHAAAGNIEIESETDHLIPGTPTAAAIDWAGSRAFVLSDDENGVELTAVHITDGGARTVTLPFTSDDPIQLRAAGIALAAGGAHLLVAATLRSPSRADGGRISRVLDVDARTLDVSKDLLDTSGAISAMGGLLAVSDEIEFWVRAFDEVTGFAYATEVGAPGGVLAISREEAFRSSTRAPQMMYSPAGHGWAMAAGRTLRVLNGENSEATTRVFEQSVESVAWTQTALYVGEGPIVHTIDPATGATIASSGPALGFVVDITPVAVGAAPFDPGPPRLGIPSRIELDAGVPGFEARIVPIDLAAGESARIVRPDRIPRWLRATWVEAPAGRADLLVEIHRQATEPIAGEWRTRLVLAIEGTGGTSRIEAIDVDVVARRGGPRVIEWHMGDATAAYSDTLGGLLSGPPLHFSHRMRRGPFARPPRDATAAVVGLDDVARGAITRQVLLDYVSGGGGLLVVAGHRAKHTGEALERWLEPLGLLIDTEQDVNGHFAIDASPRIDFGLNQIAIASGAYIEMTKPMDVSVQGPAPDTTVLALTRYGYGRLGVLASDTPLRESALGSVPARRFVRELFGWLAGATLSVRDSDHDGLRDDVEDADGSGSVERGETDPRRDDTDGDGVSDGAEDFNLNGQVDDGETDPRRADTDGDGVPDGADAEPLPHSGSPVILAVNPKSAPAQGGTLLEITGRNLPANPKVWFGDRQATHVVRLDSTRLLAAPPASPDGLPSQAMPVRVVLPVGKTESTLDRAFSYRAATPVRQLMETVSRVRRSYDGYRGAFSLVLELGDVQIEYGEFLVQAEPAMNGMNAEFETDRALVSSGRAVGMPAHGPNKFRVVFSSGEPLTGRVELGVFSWFLADPAPTVGEFRWNLAPPDLRVQWGGSVNAPQMELPVNLNNAIERPDRVSHSPP